MDGIAHIFSSVNAPWCAWTMFGLLLCVILSEWFQPGVVSQAHLSLVVRNDRLYKEAPANFMGQFLVSLFRIGTLALALCLCWAPENQFSFGAFGVISGLIIAVCLVKMLCNTIADYTFTLSRRFGAPYEHYGNLFTLVALVLYPVLLLLLRCASPLAARWCLGIIMSIFLLLWIYRTMRTYITTPVAMLYVLVYICTLEILPFVGLAYLSAKTISIL